MKSDISFAGSDVSEAGLSGRRFYPVILIVVVLLGASHRHHLTLVFSLRAPPAKPPRWSYNAIYILWGGGIPAPSNGRLCCFKIQWFAGSAINLQRWYQETDWCEIIDIT